MSNHTYCVIMAGGIGSRFWPMSRRKTPKQFLDILNTGRTLIQQTYDRLSQLCDKKNIYVVTSDEHVHLVKEQLPELPEQNIIGEPARRNTAPCIAYAAYKIKKSDPEANLVISPADHLIRDTENFTDTLKKALEFTKDKDVLLTLGIKPTRPETGYGYIQMSEEITDDMKNFPYVKKVKLFTEKPDKEVAEVFVKSGEFLWNSGIFIFSAKAIINALKIYMKDLAEKFEEIYQFLNTPEERKHIEEVYKKVKSISIDYGVMENAKNVFVIPSDFDWSDLGTWRSLYEVKFAELNDKNIIMSENVRTYYTENVIVNVPGKKVVVLNGVKDLIIVEADGMLLVSSFDDEQKLRQIVTDIRLEKGDDYV